jgi:BirA family biotin operon repressor/biotin-[acetyl-CoA-carboxylase] ligase
MAAVATAEAIEKTSGLHPMMKWPNDLLMEGRKLAGLLNEIHSETDRVHFVILGIGVNLNTDEKTFSQEIREFATSLKRETGKTVSRKVFLQHLLQALEKWYDIFNRKGGLPILQAWRNWAHIEGKQVRITSFGEQLSGRAVDVDSDGALILETAHGQRKRIVAGDVEYTKKKT